VIFPDLTRSDVYLFDSDYDLETEEDTTLLLSIGYDQSKSADIEGLGWGRCYIAESDLEIACLNEVEDIGRQYQIYEDNRPVEGTGSILVLPILLDELNTYSQISYYDNPQGLAYLSDLGQKTKGGKNIGSGVDLIRDEVEDIYNWYISTRPVADYEYIESEIRDVETDIGVVKFGLISIQVDEGAEVVSYFFGLGVEQNQGVLIYNSGLFEGIDREVQLKLHQDILQSIQVAEEE
jgi:hypothetical protein